MSHPKQWRSLGCISALALLHGCLADDTVNLGGGEMGTESPRGARCIDSPVVAGDVHVASQAQMEELAGCEQIDGSLYVEIFAGADLSPLASLQAIDGTLKLGDLGPGLSIDEASALSQAEFDQRNEDRARILADGYLSSLAGLEGLKRAGVVAMQYITADDLAPLLSLREIGHADYDKQVRIEDAPFLRSLHGLENVELITGLALQRNPELESLAGVVLGEIADVVLVDVPKLASLAELAPIGASSSLTLENVGVTSLDKLSSLSQVSTQLEIRRNAQLLNVDALQNVSAGTVYIEENAQLRSIPALRLMDSLDAVYVIDNPELESLGLALPPQWGGVTVQGGAPAAPVEAIDIGRNAKLRSVSLAEGLAQGRFVAIYDNPLLESLSLGTLNRVEDLRIEGNAALDSVDVAALQSVNILSVTGNPSLDTTAFADMRTFDLTLSGNGADPSSTPSSPAP